jgi:hypothetical protein
MFCFSYSSWKYSVYKVIACFVYWKLLRLYVYSFCPVELLIVEHMISMATTSKTNMVNCSQFVRNWIITSMADAT